MNLTPSIHRALCALPDNELATIMREGVVAMPDHEAAAMFRGAHMRTWPTVPNLVPVTHEVRRAAVARRAAKPKLPGTMKPARAPRAPSAAVNEALALVFEVVRQSKGLAASEVAKRAGISLPRTKAALRTLKSTGGIFQGGDRRFARYAGDQSTANAASTAARGEPQRAFPMAKRAGNGASAIA